MAGFFMPGQKTNNYGLTNKYCNNNMHCIAITQL